MNSRVQVRLIQAGAVAVPVVAVVVFKLMSGSAPAPSVASPMPGSGASVVAPAAPMTTDQKRALEWSKAQESKEAVSSPLTPPEARAGNGAGKAPSPAVPSVVGVEFTLTSILKSGGTSIAAINGRLYRAGEQVKPGCVVESIDAKNFKVRIRRADGTLVELSTESSAGKSAPKAAPGGVTRGRS